MLNKPKLIPLLILITVIGLLIVFGFAWKNSLKTTPKSYTKQELLKNLKPITLKITDKNIPLMVEVADNDLTRTQGLANRHFLTKKSGMLFIFNDVQIRNFWMKDTLMPLDILFFDQNHQLINLASMKPCLPQEICEIYSSKKPAQYALEVYQGFGKDHSIDLQTNLILELKF